MSNIWFTSDLHFGHTNIIKYCNRPWQTVDEMNAGLVERWNSKVQAEDIVYFLGDFSLSPKMIGIWTAKLNGKKFMIPGNHDAVHPMHRKAKKQQYHGQDTSKSGGYFQESGWTVLDPVVDFKPKELSPVQTVALKACHFPYQGDSDPYGDRYPEWRPKDEGMYMVCGHTHSSPEERRRAKRILDIGCDGHDWFPWSIEEIMQEFGVN